MPEQVTVPADLVGLTQSEAEAKLNSAGLVARPLPRVSSATVPTDRVIGADPAAGKSVDRGSAVNLEVSSGPEQVKTPKVVGLKLAEAKKRLKAAGLAYSVDKLRMVSSQNPDADTLVSPASQVELEVVSSTSWIAGAYSLLGLALLGLMALGVFLSGSVLLRLLANKEIARGLITFLIAIVTVGIAIILAVSTLNKVDEGDQRFDKGKQILTMLIGVLGTIVGFYFGSAPAVTQPTPPLAITSTMLPDGSTNTAYLATLQSTGGTPPVNWSVTPALPAGLTLDVSSGTISGNPKAASSKIPYTFKVTDSAAPAASVTAKVPLEIKQ
jgi:hypothetical protein